MTIRWGLLGTARINRLLISAIRASGRSSVAAIGSRDANRAAADARQWDIPQSHGSYEALLDSPIDIIYNSLPNSLHVPWTCAAVAAGRHVLCERPLALSAADVDDVIASTRGGIVVTEGFMYRHHAQTTALLDIVRGGAVGSLRAIVSGFNYRQAREHDVRARSGDGRRRVAGHRVLSGQRRPVDCGGTGARVGPTAARARPESISISPGPSTTAAGSRRRYSPASPRPTGPICASSERRA